MCKLKKLFRRVFLSSAFRKTLLGYTSTLLVVVILFLGIMTGFAVSEYRKSSLESSKQLVRQLAEYSERVQDEVEVIMNLVMTDSATRQFVQSEQDDKVDNYTLFLLLNNLRACYPFLSDISVVNLKNDTAVHAMGSETIRDPESSAFVRSSAESGKYVGGRTLIHAGKVQYVVSFVQILPYYNSAVLVDVESLWLSANLGTERRAVYIIDASGSPISENTRAYADENIAEELFDMVTNAGSQNVYVDSKAQQLYFFEFSERLGWWFIDLQDYSSFYSGLKRLTVTLLLISAVIPVTLIVASVIFSRKVKKPLRQLANKCREAVGMETVNVEDEMLFIDHAIAKVEHEQYQSEQFIQMQFLSNLIVGKELPFLVSKECVRKLRSQIEAPYYAVLLIRFQPKTEIAPEKRGEEYRILRYTMCNLSDEIFGEPFKCKTAEMGEDTVAVLLMLQEERVSEEYQISFNQLKIFVDKEVGIRIAGSLGPIVSAQQEIGFSYTKAAQYLDLNRIANHGELVDFNNATGISYQEKNERLAASIEEYAVLHLADPDLSLKGIAQHFDLSAAYLGKIFKSVSGQSFAAFLMQRRLELSRTALLETKKTVAEIAVQSGFSNATYFTTAFKNAYDMTPTAFRNQIRKKDR